MQEQQVHNDTGAFALERASLQFVLEVPSLFSHAYHKSSERHGPGKSREVGGAVD